MATPSTAYYRGISPRQLAGEQSVAGYQPRDIISMYNPEAQAGLIGAVAQRQQRFDAATQGVAQEIARIGEIETYDRDLLEGQLRGFEDRINTLVQDKYGGDYSAAANELATMVGQERGNPFFAFNKQKVEATKAFMEDRRKLGANFMSAGDPTGVGFEQWKAGEADFGYTPINSQDITATSAQIFKNYAQTLQNDPRFKPAPGTGGQYLLAMIQEGFASQDEVDEFLASPEGEQMMNQVRISHPELAKVGNQAAVEDAIRLGAYEAIGGVRQQVLADKSFDPDAGKTTGPSNIISPARVIESPIEEDDVTSDYFRPFADQMAKSLGYDDMATLQKQVNKDEWVQSGKMSAVGHAARAGTPNVGSVYAETQAQQDLRSIKDSFSEEFDKQGFVMDDINTLASAVSKDITAINTISDNFDEYFSKRSAEWEGIDKKSKKELDKIIQNRTVEGININPVGGLSLLVSGETKDEETTEAIVRTDNQLLIRDIAFYYGQLDPSKNRDYQLYLEWLRENNPTEYSKLAQIFAKPNSTDNGTE